MIAIVIIGIAILSCVIVIHELGHFVVARLTKIKVEELVLGFGKKIPIWRLKSGTTVCIGIIPFGGYNKLCDRNDATILGDKYVEKGYLAKVAVIIAGSTANLFTAFLALFASIYFYGTQIQPSPLIVDLSSNLSLDIGEIKTGSKIIEVDGRAVNDWKDVKSYWFDIPGSHTVVVEDQSTSISSVHEVTVTEMREQNIYPEQYGIVSIYSNMPACVRQTIPGTVASQIGLENGDCITSLNGNKISSAPDLFTAFQTWNKKDQLLVGVEKSGGEKSDIRFDPGGSGYQFEAFGVVLIDRLPENREYCGFYQCLLLSFENTTDYLIAVIAGIKGIISGAVSVSSLGSVYSIGKYGNVMVSLGWAEILKYIAVISISVAVFNMLPLYILDGGQLISETVTTVTKKRISQEIERVLINISLFIIIGLGFIAIYNDIQSM